MLIEFRVTNFRSIRDHQALSLVANASREHRKTHVIHPEAPATPDLLRSAVIYGPNASGKSNLIRALRFMQQFVLESSGKRGPTDATGVTPFAFDPQTQTEPSSFEVSAIADGQRFQYGFVIDKTRVHDEWLIVYASNRGQTWFERSWDSEAGGDEYETKFGPHVKGEKAVWERSTRSNALLLSTAIQLNAFSLIPFYEWFANVLEMVHVDSNLSSFLSSLQCEEKETHDRLVNFLRSADLNVQGAQVERRDSVSDGYFTKRKIYRSKLRKAKDLDEILVQDFFQNHNWPINAYKTHLLHATTDGKQTPLALEDESDGTRKLFALAGPILNVLDHGNVFVVDELDTSLHPAIVRLLIGLFHDQNLNSKGAQLVFSTHDTSVLDQDVFRRDQVWFVEADGLGASTIYPLTDFHPRKGENLEKGYLNGRYGALPFIGGLRFESNDG